MHNPLPFLAPLIPLFTNPSHASPTLTQLNSFPILQSLDTPSAHTNALNETNPYQCVTKPEWNMPGFTLQDCESVLDYLFIEELSDGGNIRLDFLAPEAKYSRQHKKVQNTPRKYTFRTCTIAVVMTSYFKPGELPGGHRAARFDRDTSTWRKVWQTAAWILRGCVEGKHMAGWEFTGERSLATVPPAFRMLSIGYVAFFALVVRF